MSHEQSETVQLPSGRWRNVFGRNTPRAGEPLEDLDYGSVEEATAAARARSESAGGRGFRPIAGAQATIARASERQQGRGFKPLAQPEPPPLLATSAREDVSRETYPTGPIDRSKEPSIGGFLRELLKPARPAGQSIMDPGPAPAPRPYATTVDYELDPPTEPEPVRREPPSIGPARPMVPMAEGTRLPSEIAREVPGAFQTGATRMGLEAARFGNIMMRDLPAAREKDVALKELEQDELARRARTVSGGEESTALKAAGAAPQSLAYAASFLAGGAPAAVLTTQPQTVDAYKKARELGNDPIVAYLAAQGGVLAEVVPERFGWQFLTQLFKLPAGASKAQLLRAIGVQQVGEHTEEQITNLANFAIDRMMGDPTATPERLLADAKETAKVTAFLAPAMTGAAMGARSVAQAIPELASRFRQEAQRAAPERVEPTLEAEPVRPQPSQPSQPTQPPPGPAPAATDLQNRNRSTAASIAQMNAIAGNPDPARVSFSRDFLNGAPAVIDAEGIPTAQLGRKDRVVTASGREVPVQYAVVEAETLLPSHNVNGSKNKGYLTGQPGRLRVTAGNARAAGLQAAYGRGTTARYLEGIAQDSNLHGVSPEAIRAMKRPILVRVMDKRDVTANFADETNTVLTQDLSPPEKAANDARRIDVRGLTFGPEAEITSESVRQFVRSLPATERAGLIDERDQPTRQAYDRLTNAIFMHAYGDPELVALQSQAVDTDARTVMAGLARAAPEMLNLEGGADIRPFVIEAAKTAINARRAGVPLTRFAQQAEMGRSPETSAILEFFAENIRSAKKIGEGLIEAARAGAGRAKVDLFGEAPQSTLSQALKAMREPAVVGAASAPGRFVAALRLPDGEVVEARPNEMMHGQIVARLARERNKNAMGVAAVAGFVDHTGKFLTREEATKALGYFADTYHEREIGPVVVGTAGGMEGRADYYEPFKKATGKYPWEMPFEQFYKRTISKLKAAQPGRDQRWYEMVIRSEWMRGLQQGEREPMVVGTGAAEPFEATVYRGGRAGEKRGPRAAGSTRFYTDSPEVASAYATYPNAEGGNVERARVRLERPLVLDAKGATWDNIRWTKEQGGDNEWYDVDELTHITAIRRRHDGIIIKNVRDSAVMENAKPSTTYVVFGDAPIVGSGERLSLGFKRADMPQIRARDHAEFERFAKAKGAPLVRERVPLRSLRLAQAEINPDQVAQLGEEALKKPTVISGDDYILDGANRWARLMQDNPKGKIDVLRIPLPVNNAIALMHSFPRAFKKRVGDIGPTEEAVRTQVKDVIKKARDHQPDFENMVTNYANGNGAGTIIVPPKGEKRALEKVLADYNGNAQRLRDANRASIVVNGEEQARRVAEQVANGEKVLKKADLYGAGTGLTEGFKVINIQAQKPWGAVEMQINTPEMIGAQHHAHILYEMRDGIKRRVTLERRKETPAEVRLVNAINERMREIFTAAETQAVNRVQTGGNLSAEELSKAGLAAQERGAALSKAERETWATILSKVGLSIGMSPEGGRGSRESGRPPGTSQAVTVRPSTVTGIPSKSQYATELEATGGIIQDELDQALRAALGEGKISQAVAQAANAPQMAGTRGFKPLEVGKRATPAERAATDDLFNPIRREPAKVTPIKAKSDWERLGLPANKALKDLGWEHPRTQYTRSASTSETALITRAIDALIAKGMPAWMPQSVRQIFVYNDNFSQWGALYAPSLNMIGISETSLDKGQNVVEDNILHESAHALDMFPRMNEGAKSASDFLASAFSPRLKMIKTRSIPDYHIQYIGDLAKEAHETTSGAISWYLMYPLSHLETGTMSAEVAATELFAQVSVLYRTQTEALATHMPKWYKAMEEIYGTDKATQPQTRNEAHARLREALQVPRSLPGEQVGGEERIAAVGTARTVGAGAPRGPPGSRVGGRAREAGEEIRADDSGRGDRPGGDRAGPPVVGAQANPYWNVDEPNLFEALRREWQDKGIDLKKTQQAIERAGGVIPQRGNAYLAEERYHGRVTARTQQAHRRLVKPLLEAIKDSGLSVEDVGRFLWARHVPERNRQMAKINPGHQLLPTNLAGMTDAEAQRVINDFARAGKRPALNRIAALADQLSKETRELLVREGLEERSTIDQWEKVYKHYVPLFRDLEQDAGTGQGFQIRGPESKRAMGSEREAVAIIAALVTQHERAIIRAEKAAVGRSLIRLAEEHPNPQFWRVDTPPTKRAINPQTGMVQVTIDPQYKQRDDVFIVKEKDRSGSVRERVLAFNPRSERAMKLVAAMKNVDVVQLSGMTKAVGKVTRILANLATSWNPQFWVTNFLRDVQTASVNVQSTALQGQAPKIIANIPNAIAGIMDAEFRQGTGKWASLYRMYEANGGKTGWMTLFDDLIDRQKQIVSEIKAAQRGNLNPLKWGGFALETIETVNSAIENATRLSAFARALEIGQTPKQAASIAKNMTVNFNRKGNRSSATNAWYMFFNANVQGTARLIQALVKSPKAQAMVGGMVAFAAAMELVNRMIGDADRDDDDNNPYELISEGTKQKNMIFMVPGSKGNYVTVPLPYGFNVFFNAGRMMMEAVLSAGRAPLVDERKRPLAVAWNFAQVLIDSFMPLGQSSSLAQLISPTILDPAVQYAENKTWFGGPIRPEPLPFGPAKPNHQLYFRTTSDTAKDISKWLSDATGGDELRGGSIDISPTTLTHIFGTITGGAGRTGLGMFDFTKNQIDRLTGAEPAPMPWQSVPFVGRVYGEVTDRERSAKFFRLRKEALDAMAQVRAYRKAGEHDKADKIEEASPELIAMAREIASSSFRKDLKGLRDEFKEVEKLPRGDRAKARRELQSEEATALGRALRAFNEERRANP